MAVDPPANTSRSAEPARSGLDADALQRDIIDNLICLQARYPAIAAPHDWYMALAYSLRDRMLARWRPCRPTPHAMCGWPAISPLSS